jgi:hypothetical protein
MHFFTAYLPHVLSHRVPPAEFEEFFNGISIKQSLAHKLNELSINVSKDVSSPNE